MAYLLALLNLFTFILYGMDKWLAKKKKHRISESTLLLFSFLYGSFGALMGMFYFRHKTRKKKFTLLLPLFLLIQVYGLLILIK